MWEDLEALTDRGTRTLHRGTGALFLLERMPDYLVTQKARVARTFQNIRLFPGMTVLENLLVAQHNVLMKASGFTVFGALGFPSYARAERAAVEKARYWLDRIGLIGRADDPAAELPYGAQRRLEIARAMCTDPVLLCLDEPAAGLNANESAELGDYLRAIRGEHTTSILLIEHDMSVVMGITAFAPLLDRVDITGAIITADALHTQDEHARYLHRRGAHYVLVVKGNRPRLHRQLAGLPWADIPAVDLTHNAGHGRRESRILKLAALRDAVTGGILFPYAQLAVQIVRRRRPATSTRWHSETVYAVTDLSWQQIRADQLAEAIREHWHVENRLHWIRDVTFAEDLSQIRVGHGPANMATLRNLALSRHRIAGATNIAAASRHVGRHPNRVLPLLT